MELMDFNNNVLNVLQDSLRILQEIALALLVKVAITLQQMELLHASSVLQELTLQGVQVFVTDAQRELIRWPAPRSASRAQ